MATILVTAALNVVACGSDTDPTTDSGSGDAGLDGSADAAGDVGVDAGPPCDGPPGLYSNAACDQIFDGILPYTPRFTLWSDGTSKDRFIEIPDRVAVSIDTQDPDGWVFPVGTRIWKNFSLGGVKLETRLLEKTVPGTGYTTWSVRTFQWRRNQVEVVELFDGANDVLDTDHDIPSVRACGDCHDGGGQPDAVLGFGSIQLNHSGTTTSLVDLDTMGLLSQAVPAAMAEVPGDATTVAALGYMHANCGHCHGQVDPEAGLVLFLETGLGTVNATGAYRTAVNVVGTWAEMGSNIRVVPGSPSTSTLYQRMNVRNDVDNQMPPLATEIIDPTGLSAVERWIMSL